MDKIKAKSNYFQFIIRNTTYNNTSNKNLIYKVDIKNTESVHPKVCGLSNRDWIFFSFPAIRLVQLRGCPSEGISEY